jgi:hypothetical protein
MEFSVTLLHDSAIEDCIVSEIPSTSKVRTSYVAKKKQKRFLKYKKVTHDRNTRKGDKKSAVWALCERTEAV